MRYAFFVVICAVTVVPMLGCPLPTGFDVNVPMANDTDSQEFSILITPNKLVIDVIFSQVISMPSLVAGSNVILETELQSNADIIIQSNGTKGIRITSVADYGSLLNFDPNGFFTLHLQPDGSPPIRTLSGEALDGDDDGLEGGAWQTTFLLLGK